MPEFYWNIIHFDIFKQVFTAFPLVLFRRSYCITYLSIPQNNIQTLEPIQQEKVNLSTKLVDKRTSYVETEEELGNKLKEQQDWLNKYMSNSKSGQNSLVHVNCCESRDDAYRNMVKKLDAAKAKVDNLTQMRSELASERHKVKQSLEELNCRMDSYEPKLRDMPSEAL
ncbi:hypothetical protein Hdeb2414_s0215g00836181 [Helianthus debilis subsp. tardiflorus]